MSKVVLKTCTKCGEQKPATSEFFYPHDEGKGGLRPDCRACHNQRSIAYRLENLERVSTQKKQYRKANREKLRAANRAYYEKNKEKCIEYSRKRNEANKDEYNARLRAWRKRNKDKVNVWTRNRRAKQKQLGGSHTYQDIEFFLAQQRGLCACCRVDISKSFQVDHVIPVAAGGSNDRGNLQLLCKPCNLTKRARDPVEFMQSRGFLL